VEVIELAAAKRTLVGKHSRKLRASGKVPVVLYGRGVKVSEPLEVDAREMERVYEVAGGNKIVALKVGSAKPHNVLIHEVQLGGLRGEVMHVDFYAVNMAEEITAEIPLHYVGESNAVYRDEGTLVKQLETVEVRSLPGDLPESIEVDITLLDDFEKTITLGDLVIPAGVKLVDEDLEQLVAKVEPPRSEAEMAELEEPVGDTAPASEAAEGDTAEASDAK